ncbi:MAG: hypothetical protein K0Q70_1171, partial [Rhodospirillales bacterium]|nr:hypothetical protein [Rhodospirillales bacterium]
MGQTNPSEPDLGLGFRFDLRNFIADNWSRIDTLELTVDHYIDASQQHREEIEHLVGRKPLVAHGVGLSLGTDAPLDEIYLRRVAEAVERLGLAYYSEHLAFTRVPDRDLATLLPLPRTSAVIEDIVNKIKMVRS